ncbi:MAG: hypothetical protein CML60_06465 [Rhodobacteraceae bacterium]|nr:hypothetical protein [Paracoccaceae bacterium]
MISFECGYNHDLSSKTRRMRPNWLWFRDDQGTGLRGNWTDRDDKARCIRVSGSRTLLAIVEVSSVRRRQL